jgi:His/Glu/Gln/Arg/opine family amino acid ABC transporter permease subunit
MLHGYGASLLQGALLTLSMAAGAGAVALVLGLAGAVARLSGVRALSLAAQAYTSVIRGVPDLVLMLLIYYGGQQAINAFGARFGLDYIDIDPFVAGVGAIGFMFGAYFAEIFRGAFLAVPTGQKEAALACGMSGAQVLWRIVGPQMLRHALPPLSNCWLVLIKSTAIVSLVGLSDLMQRAATASGTTREPFLFYGFAALVYLAFTSVSELGFAWLQRRLSVGQRVASQ